MAKPQNEQVGCMNGCLTIESELSSGVLDVQRPFHVLYGSRGPSAVEVTQVAKELGGDLALRE